ncbi:portal protein [uncultured Methanobrevibacter sp.]|uniref:portal protein n=1 Tax=uncultured Methanobrevibacter sp. TaxID=253161 RepID=UPI0025D0275D|nr:portal protein [uncultured Methanobrevibacter sp.]
MAGFTTRFGVLSNNNSVSKYLKTLSNLGMNYDDMVIRNSRAIGVTEAELGYQQNPMGFLNDDMYSLFASLSLTDISLKKNISFFDKNYAKKREELRNFALQDEIEDILDIISDEAIVTDETGKFSYFKYSGELKDELLEECEEEYNKIMIYLGFTTEGGAWNYFRKWLIDGYLAFEIIYDNEQKEIIGFKELDPCSLMPAVEEKTNKKIWIQYKDDRVKERVLYDSQIIYISYSQTNSAQRVSYVERLIRSFNLLRIMETTRIIWAVNNSSFKTKFIIPVGGQSKNRSKQSLATLMNNYHEIVDFDFESGTLKTNGKPMMQFSKEYWLPSKDGDSPEIDTLGGDGPDISDVEALKYFSDKLKKASKIPFTRFDTDNGTVFEMDATSTLREEIKFSKFIDRLRAIYKEIWMKPLYIQMCLNHTELSSDFAFRNSIGCKYVKDNIFEELKEMELSTKRAEYISTIKDSYVEQDAEMNDIPYFDLDYLVEQKGGFSPEFLEGNKQAKERKKLKKEGYSDKDIEKILNGADKSQFKPNKEDTSDEDDPLSGLNI